MAMEDNKDDKKRAREESGDFESEADSVPFLKLSRVDLASTGTDSPEFTHVEPDVDDGDFQLPEAKCIQDDLLNLLDDSDPVIGSDPAIQGLDSVLKSFEEEIPIPTQATLPVISSDSGESRPELGFLLEASDDELGLPPSFSFVGEEQKFGTVDVEEIVGLGADAFGEMMGPEFSIPSCESFDFGICGDSDTNSNNNHSNSCDFVALGGLFEPMVDVSELKPRPESLSAL